MSPRGSSLHQTVEGMSVGFDAAAGAPPSAVIELAFDGAERGTYQLVLAGDACRFEPAPVAAPTLRIETDADTWRAVSEGRLQAMTAVLDGRMKVEGDLGLFQRFPRMFRRVTREDLRAPPEQRAPGPIRLPPMMWLLVALLPWKLFWVVTGVRGPSTALAVAALAAGALLAARTVSGGATFLERATAVVFAVAAAAALAGGGAPAGSVPASLLALAAIWTATLVHARHPLTAEYSRWNYVPRLWATTLFRHPNAVLTLVWGGVFTVLAVLAEAGPRVGLSRGATTALSVAICLAAGEFTRRHEAGARDRRIGDPPASLARLARVSRVLLAIIAAGFLLGGPLTTRSGWAVAPAAVVLAAALWPRPSLRPATPP